MWLWSTSAPELLFDHASQVVLARMREIQEADDGESVDLKSINIYSKCSNVHFKVRAPFNHFSARNHPSYDLKLLSTLCSTSFVYILIDQNLAASVHVRLRALS